MFMYAYRGFSRSTARDREVGKIPLNIRDWQLDSNGRKIRNWWYGRMYPHSANTPFPSPGPGGQWSLIDTQHLSYHMARVYIALEYFDAASGM
jgi:hypothetical protein